MNGDGKADLLYLDDAYPTNGYRVMLSTGTAWVLMGVVDADTVAGVPEWVNLYFHAVPGQRLGGQLVGGFGATIDWWLRQGLGAADAPEGQDCLLYTSPSPRD